jgi:Zn-dependent M32 family carboxypeptidase
MVRLPGQGKEKRAVVMLLLLVQELKMITQPQLRKVMARLQQELMRNTGRLAREHKALTTDSHSKV